MGEDLASAVVCTNIAGDEVARVPCRGKELMDITLGQIRAAVDAGLAAKHRTVAAFLKLVTSSGTALAGPPTATIGEVLRPEARTGPQWRTKRMRADDSQGEPAAPGTFNE